MNENAKDYLPLKSHAGWSVALTDGDGAILTAVVVGSGSWQWYGTDI